jgi:hypothetical protein
MDKINVAVVGTGWCGGIRADVCANHPLVNDLHLAEVKAERLAQIAGETGAVTATADYRELLEIADLARPRPTTGSSWRSPIWTRSSSRPRPKTPITP